MACFKLFLKRLHSIRKSLEFRKQVSDSRDRTANKMIQLEKKNHKIEIKTIFFCVVTPKNSRVIDPPIKKENEIQHLIMHFHQIL